MQHGSKKRKAAGAIPVAVIIAGLVGTATPAWAGDTPPSPMIGGLPTPPVKPLPSGVCDQPDTDPCTPSFTVEVQASTSPNTNRATHAADATGGWTQTADVVTVAPAGQNDVITPVSVGAGAAAAATNINIGWTGCQAIDTSIRLKNDYVLYSTTLFVYHQHLDWCGDGNGSVTKPNHYDYVSEVAGNTWQVGPSIQDNAEFYDAWGGYPKSGYNAFTQRRMDNFLLLAQVNVGSRSPWVRNIGFADGVYWTDAGIS